jgi:hypothetical protein
MDTTSMADTAQALMEHARAAAHGRSAQTVHRSHDRALRQTVVARRAGTTLHEHDAAREDSDAPAHRRADARIARIGAVAPGASLRLLLGGGLGVDRQQGIPRGWRNSVTSWPRGPGAKVMGLSLQGSTPSVGPG